MATRRMASIRTITGSMSEMQRRLRYLEGRPSPSRLSNHVVTRTTIQPRAVATDQIAFDAVTNDQVAANAIAQDQLQDNSVGTAELIEDSVTSEELAPDSVYDENIATDAVGNSEIDTDAVGTGEIQDGSVTEEKLASDSVTESKIAADSVGSSELQNESVNTEHISDGAVEESKIKNEAVTTEKIKNEAVIGYRHILSNSIVNSRLADNIISNRNIQTSAVRTTNIQNSAVTTPKLASSSVSNSKIQNNAIDSRVIANSSVGSLKIDNSVVSYVYGSGGISSRRTGKTHSLSLNWGNGANNVPRGNHTHNYAGYGHIHGFTTGNGGFPSHNHSGQTGPVPSSVRYKEDFSDHELGNLEKILDLKIKRFRYKDKYRRLNRKQKWQYGVMAEEVEGLGLKELIDYDSKGRPDKINYPLMGLYALQIIKKQQDEIDLLKTQVARLMETK